VAQPDPPHIDAIQVLPDGRIQLQVSGLPARYGIDGASNFSNWLELSNFVTTNSPFQYVDAETNLWQRFYRARLVP
jgi:hypothetical protein